MKIGTKIMEWISILALVRPISWPILLLAFPKSNAIELATVFDQRSSDSTVIDEHGVFGESSSLGEEASTVLYGLGPELP